MTDSSKPTKMPRMFSRIVSSVKKNKDDDIPDIESFEREGDVFPIKDGREKRWAAAERNKDCKPSVHDTVRSRHPELSVEDDGKPVKKKQRKTIYDYFFCEDFPFTAEESDTPIIWSPADDRKEKTPAQKQNDEVTSKLFYAVGAPPPAMRGGTIPPANNSRLIHFPENVGFSENIKDMFIISRTNATAKIMMVVLLGIITPIALSIVVSRQLITTIGGEWALRVSFGYSILFTIAAFLLVLFSMRPWRYTASYDDMREMTKINDGLSEALWKIRSTTNKENYNGKEFSFSGKVLACNESGEKCVVERHYDIPEHKVVCFFMGSDAEEIKRIEDNDVYVICTGKLSGLIKNTEAYSPANPERKYVVYYPVLTNCKIKEMSVDEDPYSTKKRRKKLQDAKGSVETSSQAEKLYNDSSQ